MAQQKRINSNDIDFFILLSHFFFLISFHHLLQPHQPFFCSDFARSDWTRSLRRSSAFSGSPAQHLLQFSLGMKMDARATFHVNMSDDFGSNVYFFISCSQFGTLATYVIFVHTYVLKRNTTGGPSKTLQCAYFKTNVEFELYFLFNLLKRMFMGMSLDACPITHGYVFPTHRREDP